ncbi:unnamed protein product [Pylaiella littoralis]
MAGRHRGEWAQGVRSSSWDRYVAEGFVRTPTKRRRRRDRGGAPKPYEVVCAPWSREGTKEEPLFSVREEGFHLNDENRVFFSAPVTYYNDAFNCWGMGNKHSLGGSYFVYPWRLPAVQRLRRQTHVGTIASTGAANSEEMRLQCDILGLLQRGCLGHCALQDSDGCTSLHQVFVQGDLLMSTADGPGRAKAMGCKHPNSFSKFPCAYCMCEQSENVTGGELGDAKFDIGASRRTYGTTRAGFDELASLAGQPVEQRRRSKELGLTPPDTDGGELPLWTTQRINPLRHCPVERLHFDAPGSCQLN